MSADRKIDHFGSKHRRLRRMSSDDWEMPCGDEAHFARIRNTENHFEAKINLQAFPQFEPNEIDVDIYGFDLQINCRKENPADPNHALLELHRQYRLPDDTDLGTIKMRRDEDTSKVDGFGKYVKLNVVDVIDNQHPHHVIGGY